MDPRTLAMGAVTTGGILFGAKMIGLKFPYKASCWFCSNRQTITFSERNSWMCEQCDQYNGFKKDGDYNKEIRGQKADAPVQMTKKYTSSHEFKKENSKLRLCDTCNSQTSGAASGTMAAVPSAVPDGSVSDVERLRSE